MSSVELHFQDPAAGGETLLDAIAAAATGAEQGGGIFAFASVRGIEMLLSDKAVRKVVRKGGFDLVVGIDSITNAKALETLAERARQSAKLTPRVLMHETSALFHPKLCWFGDDSELTLVVGSGNLTAGGLMANFEAFVVSSLTGRSAASAKAAIDSWLELWRARLVPPDQPEAIERAGKNTGSERSLLKPMKPAPEFPQDPVPPTADATVLVAEISKNVDRRTQLDIGIEQFTGFFGAKPKGEGHILIQHVDAKGELEEVETPRRVFPTKSRNYRFEARAGAGREYPAPGAGRPFGVFVRMPDGIFRYRLLWPGEEGYAEIDAFLGARLGPAPKKRPMRRETATVAALAAAWPGSPLLTAVGGSP